MAGMPQTHVFFSYSQESQDFVESLALRLKGDARLSFWFAPWHSVPGVPLQEQMEDALRAAQSCAVFIDRSGPIDGWQNEQMRLAIQARVEDDARYRVIPVLVPGASRPGHVDLPSLLRRYERVEFQGPDDEGAFQRLLAGILGISPIQVDGYVEAQATKAHLPVPPSGGFVQGHALAIGIARYPHIRPLPDGVLDDARDLCALLGDRAACGYPPEQVVLLLDAQATGGGIRDALAALAARAGPEDTAVVFFSGHGAQGGSPFRQYLLPYDCDPGDLAGTAIAGDEMTAMLRQIQAGRLLVLLDSCHSGGLGDPKGAGREVKGGLSEGYYQALAQGTGRVVIASSRPGEVSWTLNGMRNSLFTHHLLDALRGQGTRLGDEYVRVFDLFRHVAERVPRQADQHPLFKAAALEEDFVVALAS
jgi:hypothetical protein